MYCGSSFNECKVCFEVLKNFSPPEALRRIGTNLSSLTLSLKLLKASRTFWFTGSRMQSKRRNTTKGNTTSPISFFLKASRNTSSVICQINPTSTLVLLLLIYVIYLYFLLTLRIYLKCVRCWCID